MGLLNTTIIERTAPYVEYSRTHSHVKFAPGKNWNRFLCSIRNDVTGRLHLGESYCQFQVELACGKANVAEMLCQQAFGCSLKEFV